MDAAAHEAELDKVYYQLAECYYRINDYENAVGYADRSIAKNPQYIRPYELMFNLYANLRNYEKAASVWSARRGASRTGYYPLHPGATFTIPS